MSLNNCKENSVIIKDIMEENKIIKPNLNFISKIFVN